MAVLILAVLSHALFDLGRRGLDRLFFGAEVLSLRSGLADVVREAALTPRFDEVIHEARQELDLAAATHFARLTEEALRRLNNPAALAGCDLRVLIPRTLAASAAVQGRTVAAEPTPLQRAQLLRAALTRAIERLKPPDADAHSPAALHYQILHEEYVEGAPNKQIMLRHGISESTFHRNRREAVAALARELREQEDLLSAASVER